ncbi:hypothetical protein RRG08_060067 [Elysia crispata]|uniref:Uncharacterized protein n=1 Tax=Elysia crispata TaxID=231223 RepID=A0AAE1CQU9_9GAST|nr:hypothetical protein RRG08_060067 [Elysia crispata]
MVQEALWFDKRLLYGDISCQTKDRAIPHLTHAVYGAYDTFIQFLCTRRGPDADVTKREGQVVDGVYHAILLQDQQNFKVRVGLVTTKADFKYSPRGACAERNLQLPSSASFVSGGNTRTNNAIK